MIKLDAFLPSTTDQLVSMITKLDVRKGLSPFSKPMKIIAQLGRWDYKLEDGKVWNARSLRKYRPAMVYNFQQFFGNQFGYGNFPADTPIRGPRRSQRINKGKPPIRLNYSQF